MLYTPITMKRIMNLERQLKAVGNQRRLRILSFIKKKKIASVEDICDAVNIRSQTASQHLRILRDAGIVTYTKRGSFVKYRLSLPQKQPIKQVLSLL